MGTDRPIKGHVGEPEQLTTKIYYHVDDQPTPYSTEVPIPPSKITLADFKEFINRRNFKFYYKVTITMDDAIPLIAIHFRSWTQSSMRKIEVFASCFHTKT